MRPRTFSETQAIRLIRTFETVSRSGKKKHGSHNYNQYDAARDLINQARSCWEESESGRYRTTIPEAFPKLARTWSISVQDAEELASTVTFMTDRALVQQLKRWRKRLKAQQSNQVHNQATGLCGI